MRVLRKGMTGDDVFSWESYLRGKGFFMEESDGIFDDNLDKATKKFQFHNKLTPDGVVGRLTMATALNDGYDALEDIYDGKDGKNWPPKPEDLQPIIGNEQRASVFGRFEYTPSPVNGNPEAITILHNWQNDNIVRINIPQLIGINGANSQGSAYFHKLVVDQTIGLFEAWEKAGLRLRIRTWAGSWVPRFIRGSRTTLSNHSWGTAFDINVAWNGLGSTPALLKKPGTVRELVPLANKFGFYWGGHFSRPDGMHFEVCKILSKSDVESILSKM
jgi:hypothetical protein